MDLVPQERPCRLNLNLVALESAAEEIFQELRYVRTGNINWRSIKSSLQLGEKAQIAVYMIKAAPQFVVQSL